MTPILYEATETNFTSNGLGRVNCVSCIVTEERNGVYECEFTVAMSDKHYPDIELGMFIACTHDDDKDIQPFKIYHKSAPLSGNVTFKARHISYLLSNVIVSPFTAGSVQETLGKFSTENINTNPFTFSTDKTTQADFVNPSPASVRSLMGGSEGSILDVYGGEWDFDKWNVYLKANRGTASGITIRYGKNLIDINQDIDAGGLYNSIVPFWRSEVDGVDTLVTLPEHMVTPAGINNPVPVVMDFTMEFQEQPTENELRTFTENYLTENEPWIPPETLKVDFVALWQTSEYKDVANLLKLRLCDTVSVYYPALGVTANNIKVIKTVYNVLAEKYDSIELGQPQATFAQVLLNTTKKDITNAQTEDRGFFDNAITAATDLLTGTNGGHVVIQRDANGKPTEILILDTDSLLTATNILRINLNGIGFSRDGGNTYSTAWTINGDFVANFITSGQLRAIKIQGPRDPSTQTTDPENTQYPTFWDLSDGEINNHGTNYTISAYDPTTDTTVSFVVDMDVNIKDGRYKVLGKHNSLSSQYADFGPAVQTIPEECFGYVIDWTIQPAYVSKYFPDPYVYAGLNLSGDRSNGYILSYFSHTVDGQTKYSYYGDQDAYGSYIPMGNYAPDEIALGASDDVQSPLTVEDLEDVGYVDPVILANYAPRNILRMRAGGFVGHEDSIQFEEYFGVQDVSEHGTATVEFFPDPPRIYKPVWPIKPQERLNIGDTTFWGRTYSSSTKVNITIPLMRPISEYVNDLSFPLGTTVTIRTAAGASVLSAANVNADFTYEILSKGDFALNVSLTKKSGTIGSTNGQTVSVYFSSGATILFIEGV